MHLNCKSNCLNELSLVSAQSYFVSFFFSAISIANMLQEQLMK